jgi:transcription antitermination factor NusG
MKLIDPTKVWYVVRSKVRQEERAAKHIQEAGFDVYLPIRREEKKSRSQKTFSVIEKPLMVGYLFVGFTSFARHFGKVAGCDGVYDFIKVQGEPIPVPASAVNDIQVAEMNLVFDDTREARIHRGEEERTRKLNTRKKFPRGGVSIVVDETHPFANLNVVIEEVTSSGNVKALIDLFGRATSVEFEAGQLKPAA